MLGGHQDNEAWNYYLILMGNAGNVYRIYHSSFLQRSNSWCLLDSDGKMF